MGENLDKVLGLARSYTRTEHGRVEHVGAYQGRSLFGIGSTRQAFEHANSAIARDEMLTGRGHASEAYASLRANHEAPDFATAIRNVSRAAFHIEAHPAMSRHPAIRKHLAALRQAVASQDRTSFVQANSALERHVSPFRSIGHIGLAAELDDEASEPYALGDPDGDGDDDSLPEGDPEDWDESDWDEVREHLASDPWFAQIVDGAQAGDPEPAPQGWQDRAKEILTAGLTSRTAEASTTHEPTVPPGGPGLFHIKGRQLPPYVQHLYKHLVGKYGKHRAYGVAIGIVKKWAAGVNPGGKGGGHKVHADVQAAAGKNIAEWEKDKADAHTHGETKTTMLDSEALELARDYERHGAHGTVHVRAYYSHRLMSHLRNVHGVTEDIGNDPEWHREVHVEDHEDMLATGTPSHHHLPEEDQAWMPIARVRPGSLGHLQSATRVADRHLHPLTATPNLDQVLGLAGGSPAAWPSGKPYDASFLPKPGKTPGDRTDLKQGDQRRPAGGAVASAPGTKPVTTYGHLMQAPSQTVSAGPPLPPGVSLPDPKEFEALASKIKDGPDRPLAESARTHLTTAAGKLRAEDKQGTIALLRIVQTDLHALYRKTVAANRPNEAQVFSEKGFAGSVPPAAQSSARAEMFASQDQMREYRTQVTTVAQWVDRFRRSYFHGQYQGVAEGRFTGGAGAVALAGALGEDVGKDQVKHPAGPKATKPQAHYRATDSDTKRCGTCSKLRVNPPDFESHSCIAVAGDIDPKKVCDYFVLNPDATSHALVKMARGYDRVEHGKLEHVGPYAGKQPFKFYHGTREEFSPGQVLDDKRRYYTPHRALAGNYSAGSTARSGRGERHVYEVEPVEGHEIDPEYGDSGYGWMARKIRVVREVSHAGTDEPGDVMPSRAALRKAVRTAAGAAKLTDAQVTNALLALTQVDPYKRIEHGRVVLVKGYETAHRQGHFWDSHGVKHWGWYGAAGVLPTHTDENGVQRFLIQKRAGGVQHSGTWSTAGGAIDIDPKTGVPETPQVAAQREAEEEFGDKIPHMTPTHVDTANFGDPGTAGHWQYHTVHLEAPEMFKPSGKASHGFESGGHAWVTAQEMGEYPLHPNFAEYATSKLGVFLNPDKQTPDKPKWEPPSPPNTDFRKGDEVEYFHNGNGVNKNVKARVEQVPDWKYPTYLVQPALTDKKGKPVKAIELHRRHILTDPAQFGHEPVEIPKPEVKKVAPLPPPPPGPEGMGKPREPGEIRQGDDVKWTDGNGKERTGRVSYVHSDGAVDVSKPYVAPKGGGYGSGGNVVSHGLGYAVNTGKKSGYDPSKGDYVMHATRGIALVSSRGAHGHWVRGADGLDYYASHGSLRPPTDAEFNAAKEAGTLPASSFSQPKAAPVFNPPGGPTPNPEAYAAGADLVGEPVVKGERVVHGKMGLGTAKGKQASDGFVHVLFDSGQTAYINVKHGALRRAGDGAAAAPAAKPASKFAEGDTVKRRSFSGNDWETGTVTADNVAKSALGYPVHRVKFSGTEYSVPESVLKLVSKAPSLTQSNPPGDTGGVINKPPASEKKRIADRLLVAEFGGTAYTEDPETPHERWPEVLGESVKPELLEAARGVRRGEKFKPAVKFKSIFDS